MRKQTLLAAVVVLVACATPYQQHGFRGGYDSRPLGDGVWLITVRVNAYTDAATAYEYFHRRAGEVCNGDYEVLDQSDATDRALASSGGTPILIEKANVFGRVRCA